MKAAKNLVQRLQDGYQRVLEELLSDTKSSVLSYTFKQLADDLQTAQSIIVHAVTDLWEKKDQLTSEIDEYRFLAKAVKYKTIDENTVSVQQASNLGFKKAWILF